METPSTPLTEVSPTALNELFEREPDTLTDEEVGIIVSKFRSDRAKWAFSEQIKSVTGKRSAKSTPLPTNLSLESLGLK